MTTRRAAVLLAAVVCSALLGCGSAGKRITSGQEAFFACFGVGDDVLVYLTTEGNVGSPYSWADAHILDPGAGRTSTLPSVVRAHANVAFSASKRLLYFVDSREVCSLDIHSGERAVVCQLPEACNTVSLSPDERVLALVTEGEVGSARARNLWLVEVASGGVRRFTSYEDSGVSVDIGRPVWSRRSDQVAFVETRDTPVAAASAGRADSAAGSMPPLSMVINGRLHESFVVSLATDDGSRHEWTRVFMGAELAWGPDESVIAVSDGEETYLVDRDGRTQQLLIRADEGCGLDWSKLSGRIVYVRRGDVWLTNPVAWADRRSSGGARTD